MQTDQQAEKESRRGRVRRCLIERMRADGFRKSQGVSAEDHARMLDSLADHLGYMSENGLRVLHQMLRVKGTGRDRDIWPSKATILGFAECIEQRPLEELPNLLRWFRSVAGPRARAEGTLVETYCEFRKFKKPPVMHDRMIRQRAGDNRDRLRIIDDRASRGAARAEDLDWARRYRELLAYCEALVAEGEAARTEADEDQPMEGAGR